MAVIEGDIDLTQNLDFYRKKPQKLLPVNVKLLGRQDVPESKINTSLDDKFYITTVSESSITVSYSNADSRYNTWTIDRNNERFNYIDIDDGTLSVTMYDDPADSTISSIASVRYSVNDLYITTTSSSNVTNTISVRYNLDDYIDDFSWTAAKKKIYKKKFGTLKDIKNVFSLWMGREPVEEKSSLILHECYSCSKLFLARPDFYGKCRECEREEELDKKRSIWCNINNVYKRSFNFFHVDRSDNYDYFDDIPWYNVGDRNRPRNSVEARYMMYKKNSSQRRYGIPWLQDLQSRIYDDYIEELLHGEKDYSSYLTNMGWIGISRQRDNEIIIDSLQSTEIQEIHSDDDLMVNTVYEEIDDVPLFRDESEGTINISSENIITWTNNDINTLVYNA